MRKLKNWRQRLTTCSQQFKMSQDIDAGGSTGISQGFESILLGCQDEEDTTKNAVVEDERKGGKRGRNSETVDDDDERRGKGERRNSKGRNSKTVDDDDERKPSRKKIKKETAPEVRGIIVKRKCGKIFAPRDYMYVLDGADTSLSKNIDEEVERHRLLWLSAKNIEDVEIFKTPINVGADMCVNVVAGFSSNFMKPVPK